MMVRSGLQIVTGISLLAAGDIPGLGEFGPIANVGAVAILGYMLLRQAQVIDRMADRWDGWEQIRHADSERLVESLAQLRENCAAVTAISDKKPAKANGTKT